MTIHFRNRVQDRQLPKIYDTETSKNVQDQDRDQR